MSDTSGFGQYVAFHCTSPHAGRRYPQRIEQRSHPLFHPGDWVRPSISAALTGAFAGAGASFLILPREDRICHLALNWDLSEMAPGAIGVSTLGINNVVTDAPPSTLLSVFITAGKLHHYPEDAGNLPFNAFWIGAPSYDAPAAMAWAAKSYQALKEFFRQPDQKPYYLLGMSRSQRPGWRRGDRERVHDRVWNRGAHAGRHEFHVHA